MQRVLSCLQRLHVSVSLFLSLSLFHESSLVSIESLEKSQRVWDVARGHCARKRNMKRMRFVKQLERSKTLHMPVQELFVHQKQCTSVLGNRLCARKKCIGLGSHLGGRKHCTDLVVSHQGVEKHSRRPSLLHRLRTLYSRPVGKLQCDQKTISPSLRHCDTSLCLPRSRTFSGYNTM